MALDGLQEIGRRLAPVCKRNGIGTITVGINNGVIIINVGHAREELKNEIYDCLRDIPMPVSMEPPMQNVPLGIACPSYDLSRDTYA